MLNHHCIECDQEIDNSESAVEYKIGWMHYYQCSQDKKKTPTEGFISRRITNKVPGFLMEGRRIW